MRHKKKDIKVSGAAPTVIEKEVVGKRHVESPTVAAVASEEAETGDGAAGKKKVYIGEFEELVLLAIIKLGANAYGVGIHDALQDATGRSFSIGALYTTLSRLEEKGLVSSWEGEATRERGGRVKRYYEVLASGQRALREADNGRRNLVANLDSVPRRA